METRSVETDILGQLAGILGSEHLLTDTDTLTLYSQDIWKPGAQVLAVARPGNTEELAALTRTAIAAGLNLVARGGGMSYTGGYTQDEGDSIVVCTRRMNQVLEIDASNMRVTVQAGCTWHSLFEALEPLGLRTPYWGPLSGKYATVGGSVSQNSIFWGGSRYGSAADSVISLELVLASGEVVNTGSAAKAGAPAFFRHFGPDLTGLFTCDCGALGLKSTVTLKLIPNAMAREYLSFDFKDHEGLLETMAEIQRQDLASECFGFDPLLTEMRAQRDSLMSDAKSLAGVVKNAGSVAQAGKDVFGLVAGGGRRFMKSLDWPMHAIVEERDAASAKAVAQRIVAIAEANRGKSVSNAIPKIMRANPFGPVNNMIGPGGERWVPVHGLVPLSKAAETTQRVLAVFEQHAEALEQFGIRCGFLYNSVGGHCIAVEPLFFWPDSVDEVQKASVEEDFYARVPKLDYNPEARSKVAQIRQEVADTFSALGASHLQLGRSYRYADALEPGAATLIRAIKQVVDPNNHINPGVLGL